jgi:acyl carrier protein
MSESAEGCAQLTLPEQLIALIRHILGPPAAARPLPIDARLADLGMSSLKMVNLMLSLEVQFDVAIPQAEINPENFVSIASVQALIVRLRDQAPRR